MEYWAAIPQVDLTTLAQEPSDGIYCESRDEAQGIYGQDGLSILSQGFIEYLHRGT